MIFLALGVLYALIRRSLFLIYPPLLSNGLFNFVVMQTLFYLPFFVLGAQTFINPRLKAMFTTPSPWLRSGAAGIYRLPAEPAVRLRRRLDV